jgi:hypothetical protein
VQLRQRQPSEAWGWVIDTVIPIRVLETQGEGKDRRHCMRQFGALGAKTHVPMFFVAKASQSCQKVLCKLHACE